MTRKHSSYLKSHSNGIFTWKVNTDIEIKFTAFCWSKVDVPTFLQILFFTLIASLQYPVQNSASHGNMAWKSFMLCTLHPHRQMGLSFKEWYQFALFHPPYTERTGIRKHTIYTQYDNLPFLYSSNFSWEVLCWIKCLDILDSCTVMWEVQV